MESRGNDIRVKELSPNENGEEASRGRGRPRCEDTRKRILVAALDSLEKSGFTQTTTDDIAVRAGASKATIYRWWSTKAELVAEALRESVAQELPFPDTGDLRRDIHIQLRNFIKVLTGPRGRVFKAFLAAAQSDGDAAAAFLSVWVKPRRQEAKFVLQKHQSAGQLDASLDLDLVLDLLYGPLYFRLLSGHGKLTAVYADEIADLALRGLEASRHPEPPNT